MARKEHMEPNIFGGFTHYDEKGHKIGTSEPNLLGGYTHYDEKGHKTGSSEPDLFGGFTEYDAQGKRIGRTDEGLLGGLIRSDQHGRKVGEDGPWLLDTREPLRGMGYPPASENDDPKKSNRSMSPGPMTVRREEKTQTPDAPEPEGGGSGDALLRARKDLILTILRGLFFVTLFSVIPAMFMWAAIKTYESGNSASILVSALVTGAGVLFILLFFYLYINAVREKTAALREARKQYEHSQDAQVQERAEANRKWIGWLLMGILVIMIAVAAISASERAAKKEAAYHDAEALIVREDYDGALELLEQMDPDYRDVSALSKLCSAHQQYDSGQVAAAYDTMKNASFYYQTDEQMEQIRAFREDLQQARDAQIKAKAERDQAEYERIQALPFPTVGQYVTPAQYEHMTYQRGDSDTCSRPTKVYYYVNGDDAYYLWISDGNRILYLHEVTIKGGTKTGGKTGKSNAYTDDLDTDSFNDPEDFYDWYRDDFIDYEEAEEYYYDHGGE